MSLVRVLLLAVAAVVVLTHSMVLMVAAAVVWLAVLERPLTQMVTRVGTGR